MIRINITKGPMKGREFTFPNHDVFIFGREESTCHVFVENDPYVSRHHFILEVNPPRLRLCDLGSRNGTIVNSVKYGGRKILKDKRLMRKATGVTVDLAHGDMIEAGKTVFRIVFEGHAETAREGGEYDSTCTQPQLDPQNDLGSGVPSKVSSEGRRGERKTSFESEHFNRPARLTRQESNSLPNPVPDQTRSFPTISAEESEDRPIADLPLIEGYLLQRPLGVGGMGAVYLARRCHDNQPVAIKFMRTQARASQRVRSSFLREMELICRLDHKNIVPGFDSGVIANDYYFVMQYCEGGPISRLFRTRPELTIPKNVARLLARLLEGLTYAHESGLVHRDLKPANILIDRRRGRITPKLGDFGLAKEFDKAGLSGLTVTGNFGGSLPFMPREQLTNYKYVTPASDVFSIAASFYRLITGFYPRPDEGRDPLEVILNAEAVPLRKRLPRYHSGIATILDTALLSDCNERYGNAREMLSELRFVMKRERWQTSRHKKR